MPAAAVIPAPIAYAKVVAVKKLVVGLESGHEPAYFRAACVKACWLGCIGSLFYRFYLTGNCGVEIYFE